MDYGKLFGEITKNEEELKEFKDREKLDWFSPSAGTYKGKFLSELSEPYEVVFKKSGSEEKRMNVNVEIEVSGGHKMIWSASVGRTKASLYGQLVVLGLHWGSLKGHGFTLLVKNDGTKNDYTLLEAQEVIQNQNALVGEGKA